MMNECKKKTLSLATSCRANQISLMFPHFLPSRKLALIHPTTPPPTVHLPLGGRILGAVLWASFNLAVTTFALVLATFRGILWDPLESSGVLEGLLVEILPRLGFLKTISVFLKRCSAIFRDFLKILCQF